MYSNLDTLPLKGEHGKLDQVSLKIPICKRKQLAIHTRGKRKKKKKPGTSY